MHILISSKPPLGLLAVSLQFANCRIKCNNVLFNSEQEIYTIHSHHTKHNSYNHPPISLLKLTQTLCNLSKYSRVYWDTKHTWANIPVFIGTSNILEQIFPCLLLGHQTYFSKYSRVYWDTKHTWANIPVFIGTLCPNYSKDIWVIFPCCHHLIQDRCSPNLKKTNFFLRGGDELAFRISGYDIKSDNNTCTVFDNFVERFDLWKKFTFWIVNTKWDSLNMTFAC